MNKFIPRRSQKLGLPPGTPVHIGQRKVEESQITLVDYDETNVKIEVIEQVESCLPFKNAPTVTWLNIGGVHDVQTIQQLGECFELHPLLLEDIMNTDQRPKVEAFDTHVYIVLKMLYYDKQAGEILGEQISLVLGSNFLLTFHEGHCEDIFEDIIKRIQQNQGRVRRMAVDYLAYVLMDTVVDHYFIMLEQYGEKIEAVEEEIIANPAHFVVYEIQKLRQDLLFLRKFILPFREVLAHLERGASSLFQEKTEIYLRDVYDHIIQVFDTVEIYRDMLAGLRDMYLSSLSNRMNEVMKTLTMFATIFIPLTFIAGIYGMNFEHMPELKWAWSYPILWALMIFMGLGMLVYFRKKGWV